MFVAIFHDDEGDPSVRVFLEESFLKEASLNDPHFPTEEAVIHKVCDTTFEVIDTFKFQLTQL